MTTDPVVRRFERLQIRKAFVTELNVDVGQEVSLGLVQDYSKLRAGQHCGRYALRFSCVEDLRLELDMTESPGQVLAFSARPASRQPNKRPSSSMTRERMKPRKTWWFTLSFTDGQVRVKAEAFCFSVVGRMQVRVESKAQQS